MEIGRRFDPGFRVRKPESTVMQREAIDVVEEEEKDGSQLLEELYRKTISSFHSYSFRYGVESSFSETSKKEREETFKKGVLEEDAITKEHLVELLIKEDLATSFGRVALRNRSNIDGAGDGGSCR